LPATTLPVEYVEFGDLFDGHPLTGVL